MASNRGSPRTPNNRTSPVWDLMNIVPEDESFAMCLGKVVDKKTYPHTVTETICHQKISRGGREKRNWTTTGMSNHLLTYHTEEFNVILEAERMRKEKLNMVRASMTVSTYFKPKTPKHSVISQPKVGYFTPPPAKKRLRYDCEDISEFSVCASVSDEFKEINEFDHLHDSRAPIQKFIQPTITETFDRKRKWSRNDHRSQEMDFYLGQMIAGDKYPLSKLSDWGFSKFMTRFFSCYQVPSRTYLTTNVIPRIYDITKNSIKVMLDEVAYLSIDTDIWSNYFKKQFISLVAHCTFENFDQQMIVLNSKPFDDSHTGKNICNIMNEMVNDIWVIPKYKIHNIIHDNASNIVLGAEYLPYESLRCFIHTTQLVIKDCILTQTSVEKLIKNCRNLNNHLKASCKSKHEFQKCLTECGLSKDLVTYGDTEVRWDSQNIMFRRIVKLKHALNMFLCDNEVPNFVSFSPRDWTLLDKLVELFEQFEVMTKVMSSAYANCSEIIPWVILIKQRVNSMTSVKNFYGVVTTAKCLVKSVEDRYDKYLTNEACTIATYCDPRYRTTAFKTTRHKIAMHATESVTELVIDHFMKMKTAKKDYEDEQQPPQDQEAPESVNSLGSEELPVPITVRRELAGTVATFKDLADELFDEEPIPLPTQAQKTDNSRILLSAEIAHYNSLPKEKPHTVPHTWWKKNMHTFPLLSMVARKYLSSPPSSVDSERLFSHGGLICTDKRSRLTSSNCEMLKFLAVNLKIIDGSSFEDYQGHR